MSNRGPRRRRTLNFRQVLVPGTRRALPFHPLSVKAVAYRAAERTDEPAVIANAIRRAKKAASRRRRNHR